MVILPKTKARDKQTSGKLRAELKGLFVFSLAGEQLLHPLVHRDVSGPGGACGHQHVHRHPDRLLRGLQGGEGRRAQGQAGLKGEGDRFFRLADEAREDHVGGDDQAAVAPAGQERDNRGAERGAARGGGTADARAHHRRSGKKTVFFPL